MTKIEFRKLNERKEILENHFFDKANLFLATLLEITQLKSKKSKDGEKTLCGEIKTLGTLLLEISNKENSFPKINIHAIDAFEIYPVIGETYISKDAVDTLSKLTLYDEFYKVPKDTEITYITPYSCDEDKPSKLVISEITLPTKK